MNCNGQQSDMGEGQNVGGNMVDPTQPQVFDALLSSCDQDQIKSALASLPDTPLGELRRLQLRFPNGDAHAWPGMIRRLEEIAVAPAPGLRLMFQAALRLYEEVVQADPDVDSSDPLRLEQACYAHGAIGVSHAQLGQPTQALEHLRVALTLARALGLRSRAQNLEIERLRVMSLLGRPAPEEVGEVLMQSMPTYRRHWGQRVQAEALMGRGAYQEAMRALGTPDRDTPHDAAMREWLHVLTYLPPARPDDHPLLSGELDYMTLTRVVRGGFRSHELDALSRIKGQPQAGYAQLAQIKILWEAGRGDLAHWQMSEGCPDPPDQAMIWLFNQILGYVETGRHNPLDAMQRLQKLPQQLRGLGDLLTFMRHMPSNHMLLLALSPFVGAAGTSLIHRQPLLIGQSVVSEGSVVRLPGRTGRTLVLEAAGVESEAFGDLTRVERKRLADALVAFGGVQLVANMGWVLRACGLLAQVAERGGDTALASQWRESRDVAFGMLSPDVQTLLSQYPPDYLQ